MRQRRQHIRVTILPPNIFSTEVELGPGGSSGGDSELDCLSFWQILVPVFSSSCSLEQGAEWPYTHGPFPLPWPDSCRLPYSAGHTFRHMHRQESAQGIYIHVPNGTHALTSQARMLYIYCIQAHKPATCVCAHTPRPVTNTHVHTQVSTAQWYTCTTLPGHATGQHLPSSPHTAPVPKHTSRTLPKRNAAWRGGLPQA